MGALCIIAPLLRVAEVRTTVDGLLSGDNAPRQAASPDQGRLGFDRSGDHLTPGQVVEVLVANRLMAEQPLLKVKEWAEKVAVRDVFGIDPSALTDDRLAQVMETVARAGEEIHQTAAARLTTHYRLQDHPSVPDITPLNFERVGTRECLEDYLRDWEDDLPSIRPQRNRLMVAFQLSGEAQVPVGYQIPPRGSASALASRAGPVQGQNLNKIRFRGLKQTVAVPGAFLENDLRMRGLVLVTALAMTLYGVTEWLGAQGMDRRPGRRLIHELSPVSLVYYQIGGEKHRSLGNLDGNPQLILRALGFWPAEQHLFPGRSRPVGRAQDSGRQL